MHKLVITLFALTLATASATAEDAKPLRILYVTGGGWHDYNAQAEIIPAGLKARANVEVTVKKVAASKQAKERHPAYAGDWAKGFDAVIHNVCNSANTKDAEWVEQITKPHREGVPAIVIHCAMHCYRPDRPNAWSKMLGVMSVNHEKHHPITMRNHAKDHPIMKGFPDTWTTPKGELYRIKETGPDTKVLAIGQAGEKKDHACVWVSQYGKARVFATTVGHHNETVGEPTYLDMLTRGVLWAAGKLQDNGKPADGYGK